MNFLYENLPREALIEKVTQLDGQLISSQSLCEKLKEENETFRQTQEEYLKLKAEIGELTSFKTIYEELKAEVARLSGIEFSHIQLKEELAQLKRLIWGSRSERFDTPPLEQLTLGLNLGNAASVPPAKKVIATYERKAPQRTPLIHTGRMKFPEHWEHIRIVINPKEDVNGLKSIGEDVTEELEYKPGKLIVNQYARPKYLNPSDGKILQGKLPSRTIEKGIPGPGLLSKIIIDKYVDHLPCYRQIQRFERMGLSIPASTMSDWISATCELLVPLYETLKKEVLNQSYLQADETPIRVLDKNKKGTTHRGFYWVYHAPLIQQVLFEYRPGRGSEGPTEVLRGFKGYLQTDGYAVYDSFDTSDIRLFHCMTHARRMFDKARENDSERAEYVLREMQLLYAVERHAREAGLRVEQRYELRQEKSVPVLKGLFQWMQENIVKVVPQSTLGKALAYTLKRWGKLCIYTQDGRLEIDNNLAENAIRPVALGRKNYLFAGSHEAAQRAAILYSLIGTCKKRGVEPQEWFKNTLIKIPDWNIQELALLLPGYPFAANPPPG